MSPRARAKGEYLRSQHEGSPGTDSRIAVTVVWATRDVQELVALTLEAGASVPHGLA